MTEEQIREMKETFASFKTSNDSLQAEVKKYGTSHGEFKEQVEKLNTALDGMEEKITAEVAKTEAAQTGATELKTRIDELEAKLARKGGAIIDPNDAKAQIAERKSLFFKALKSGVDPDQAVHMGILTADQFKAMTLADSETGGYLAPAEYVAEILTTVTEWSQIRGLARLRTTSRTAVQIPKKTQSAAAAWVSEIDSRDETQNPKWGLETLVAHEMYALAKVSKQDLEDTIFDIEGFLREEFAEQFGVTEGTAFVNGSGDGQPEGFMTNTEVGEVVSEDADEITGDGLINLYYELKEAYLANSQWVLNRSTLKEIRKLKDGNNQYLWAPGIKTDARPASILDRPYTTAPDMPDVGAGLYPVIFGDFRRGYTILDRVAMELMRDPFSSKSTGMVEISARRRVGGKVMITEALKKLKISLT
jgi:HK97 family phage major capsid protein